MKNIHIITGGSSGIGLECAKRFKEGLVLITGRTESKLEKAVEELKGLGIDAEYKTGDISSQESVDELFEYAKTLGNVKTLINSAGVSGVGADAKFTLEIDLLGTLHLIESAKKYMDKGGVVLLIASMMGHVVPPNPEYDKYLQEPSLDGAIDKLVEFTNNQSDTAYNFSKRGVHLMVRKNATEFGKKGLRIVSVSPGIIMTPMAKKAAEAHPEQMNYMKSVTPAGRNGEPEDIANAVEFLTSDKAAFITGTDLLVDGGLANILPELMAQQKKQK